MARNRFSKCPRCGFKYPYGDKIAWNIHNVKCKRRWWNGG